MANGVLVDITRCIGCRSCQIACKAWHNLEANYNLMNGNLTMPKELNDNNYTLIEFEENKNSNKTWEFIKKQCFHCKEPACVSACPVGALRKMKNSAVIYDQWLCIGCRYCMVACPFDIPKYEWDTTNPWIRKCDFCDDRIEEGLEPACVKACPMEVMYFDDYKNIVKEAKQRIKNNPDKYINYVYGEKEAGGTSWIYISDKPFEELGFKTNIPKKSYPLFTWKNSLSKIFLEEAGLLAILGGLLYVRTRKDRKGDKD